MRFEENPYHGTCQNTKLSPTPSQSSKRASRALPHWDFCYVSLKGPRTRYMLGGKVSPLHPRGHPWDPLPVPSSWKICVLPPRGLQAGGPVYACDMSTGSVQDEGGMVRGRGCCPEPECCYGNTGKEASSLS